MPSSIDLDPRAETDSDEFETYRPRAFGTSPSRPWLLACAGSALLGAIFSGLSTSDFIEHLDRQVHAVHCSFIPGAAQQLGDNGCRTVMMSPYSSLFRAQLWGGVPISLLALAVFAYLVYRALELAIRPSVTRRETLFLLIATLLPVLMSLVYGGIAAVKLDALCKLCAGVYVSSALCGLFALVAHLKAGSEGLFEPKGRLYARWFAEGLAYVAVLVFVFLVFAPKSKKSLEGCGTLVKNDDPAGVILPLQGAVKGVPSIAVLDPLCPACKGFDERLGASGLDQELNLRAVLFPLDSSCNWMVKQSLHPGACAMSEAMLCDKDHAREILSFAFAHQDELKKSAQDGDQAVRQRLVAQFPKLKGCLGSAAVKNKVNKSLRWAVANALPVLTPQLFIRDRRVCDEDTDLGLEYTIRGMLDRRPGT